MNIQSIARELIEAKDKFEETKSEYTKKRDEMYNALAAQPNCTYSWNGYRFTKLDAYEQLTTSKDSLINTLRSIGLAKEIIEKILANAQVENERGPSIRITKNSIYYIIPLRNARTSASLKLVFFASNRSSAITSSKLRAMRRHSSRWLSFSGPTSLYFLPYAPS